MLNVTDLKNGIYFQEDGTPFEVIKYEHIKMGRGTATIKVKVKNLLNGAIVMKSYISGNRVEEASLDTMEARYEYRTGTDFIFSQEDEEEEIEIPREKVGDKGQFLKKGMRVKIVKYEDDPISIDLPIKVTYTVKEAPPDARGNSVSGSFKEVLLDTNVKVKAPMFIKDGDEIIVDTRTGEYVSRA
jgi:elongation factor P